MRNPNQKQRYALDGFVPRQSSAMSNRGNQRSPRPSRSLTKRELKSQRPKEDDFAVHQDSHEALQFDGEGSGSKNKPIEIDLNTDDNQKEKKPHIWQLKKRRAYKKAKRAKWSRRKRIAYRIYRVILALLLILGIFLAAKFLINFSKVFDGNILGLFSSTKLRGEDEGRVNILLAGTSEDDIDHDGADLTDSIMLISIDTRKNAAFTVSIPRDLWVDYGRACSSGYEGKINVVYQCGNDTNFKEEGYGPEGIGLLQKTVSEVFDMPIHYYAKINYTAFRDAVNAVGGIDVKIDSDDPRGVYDPNIARVDGGPLNLTNGTHKLDGKLALALARSRNSAGGYGMARGDFDRTKYQQQMIVALKNKALSTGVLANPAKIGSLMDAAGSNVSTDFKTSELRRLYEIGQKVQSQNIKTIDLADEKVNLVTTGSYGDQSIVLPVRGLGDFTDLQQYFRRLTSTNEAVKEQADVVVLNGSGVPGAAQITADDLIKKGMEVVLVGNASSDIGRTVLIDTASGNKPKTKEMLERKLGVSALSPSSTYPDSTQYEADFIILLGPQTSQSVSRLGN